MAAVAAITLVLVWPYYSFLSLWTEASDSSAVHDPLYREILARSFLLIPGVVTFVPLFVLVANAGLIDTLPGLMLPFLAAPFGVFLMRQFILGLPRDLLDAGRVDGAGELRISTADLNRWLGDVSEKHPPSMATKGPNRRPNKLFYASQVAVRPPTIVVFCTDPKAIGVSYVRFLENRLRESFGFEGTPVRVKLRARKGRREEA